MRNSLHMKRIGLIVSAAFFAVAVVCLIAGGAALAAPSATTGSKEYFDGRLVQTWGQEGPAPAYPGFTVERAAKAVNKGDKAMVARMRYEKAWGMLDGQRWIAHADGSLDKSLILVDMPEGSGWRDGGDGWYYYERVIAPGESTTEFVSTCSISKRVGNDASVGVASAYAGMAARVDVYLECAQAFDSGSGTVKDLPKAFAPKTGDGGIGFALALCAAAALSLAVAITVLVCAKWSERNDPDEGVGIL